MVRPNVAVTRLTWASGQRRGTSMLWLPRLRLIEGDTEAWADQRELVRRIAATYGGLVRLYSLIRFRIIPLRFLEEMIQHLPTSGTILDLGCGFGLFSLYM